MATSYTFKVRQSGIDVASVTGTDRDYVLRDAMHYAMMYAQDGPPCLIREVKPRTRKAALNPEEVG